MREFIDVVFNGPPGNPSPQFVETETPDRVSTGRGIEWVQRDDFWWVLRIKPEAFKGD